MEFQPLYREKIDLVTLNQRSQELMDSLESCTLCPHSCRVNRKKGEIGQCGAGIELEVASYGPHYGEESPLVGYRGSGTIFLTTVQCIVSIARIGILAKDMVKKSLSKPWQVIWMNSKNSVVIISIW